MEKVIDIKLSDIDDFPKHPFKVIENEDMYNMRDSIIENGVLVPALVRPKPNGKYEMVSGHRRKFASKLANKETIPCIVRELTDDEATIIMVDSNLQREKVLPSEKAFAYKMKLEALKRQGFRTDLTSVQLEQKLKNKTSRKKIAEDMNESEATIQRYIRLTNLIPELLEMVDNDVMGLTPSIGLTPSVKISFLTQEEQYFLLDYIECNEVTPSLSQAIDLKELSEKHELDSDKIQEILSVRKPNQIPKISFHEEKIISLLPKNIEYDQIEDYVVKCMKFYSRYLKQKEKSAKMDAR